MSRTNETRHIKLHETCKCKWRLDASFCSNKQRWNDDKYPSNCECECDKSCNVGEYLDCEICKCRNRLVDKLVEECSKNFDEAKLAEIALSEPGNEYLCSCTVCIVLAVIALTVNIGIGAYFTYKYINRNKENASRYDYTYQEKKY